MAGALAMPAFARADDAPDVWPTLAAQIFPDRGLRDGTALVAIDAPYRAEDAAVVPLTLRLTLAQQDRRTVRKLTLVIDQNPSPLAGTFTLPPGSGIDRLSTAVRVNAYTSIHAVAELDDGGLYAASRFVKASGGCSAPGATADAGGVPRGTMRFRQFPPAAPDALPEAQLVIRHPNFSGMQMDQLSHLYIPALFIEKLELFQGESPLLMLDGGISISEDPRLRFTYKPNGAKTFRARATDSSGKTFEQTWPAAMSS